MQHVNVVETREYVQCAESLLMTPVEREAIRILLASDPLKGTLIHKTYAMYKLKFRAGVEIIYVIIEDQNKVGLVTIITGNEPPPTSGGANMTTTQTTSLPDNDLSDRLKKIGVRGVIGYGNKKAIEEAWAMLTS